MDSDGTTGKEALGGTGESPVEPEASVAASALRRTADHRARLLAVLDGSIPASAFVEEIIDRVDHYRYTTFRKPSMLSFGF